MAAPINKLLDDALLGFEDDEDAAPQPAPTAQPKGLGLGGSMLPPPAKRQGAGAAPPAPLPASSDEGQWQTAYERSSGEASTSASAGALSAGPSSRGRGRASGRRGGRLAFDPLAKRNPRLQAQKKEAEHLADDLQKLVAEWAEEFTTLNPPMAPHEGDSRIGSSSADSRGSNTAGAPGLSHASTVLQALQERTQKMVAEQARLNPTPPTSAPTPASGGLPFGGLPGLGAGAAAHGPEPVQEGHMSMIVDVVMQHLLSKEVLYQPMQEIRDKYPPWLEANRGQIDAGEFERYEQQYKCIVALCSAYETEPNNFPKLMELLQEMQACGEPPEAIVEEMSSAIAEQPDEEDADQANGTRAGSNSGVMGGLRGLFGGLRGFMSGSAGAPGSSTEGLPADMDLPQDLPLPQELLSQMPQELLDELQLPKELENCPVQ